ncbi:serine/threonine-protein phosphatase 1 regulatory subunit 10-like [Asparagus officinalis]|uniref:serine/threonine-protein phosphatase 1 regulatory subunit 10-like n=1 Tax=Asparagus officinalis TaxID=4686 RepID=UPI00098E1E86|nr:serine/threonine-protein phosphatase 1 regulatory subunit 10-like [Asparagus officinalis]
MAGDGEKELSLQDLSTRIDSMDGRFGTLEASLQNLQQAIEGLTLHLNIENNFVDCLHLRGTRVRLSRHPPPYNPQTPPVHPPPNQPSPNQPPPYQPPLHQPPPYQTPPHHRRHPNQPLFHDESSDEGGNYGAQFEGPWYDNVSSEEEGGKPYGRGRGRGF